LIDSAGYGVDIRVAGYQFPQAEDPRQRCSWHMVEGTAICSEGSWRFRYPALTCDESPAVATWLRRFAEDAVPTESGAGPALGRAALTFTEPNLSLAVVERRPEARPEAAVLQIGLDLEFSPPWRRSRIAGDSLLLLCRQTHQQLRAAADEWEQEIAPYPDIASDGRHTHRR
jgi:hypothetical protein